MKEKTKNERLCPKCGHERQPKDIECIRCGVVYAKWEGYVASKQAEKEAIRKLEVDKAAKKEQLKRQLEDFVSKVASIIVLRKKEFKLIVLTTIIILTSVFLAYQYLRTDTKLEIKTQVSKEPLAKKEKIIQSKIEIINEDTGDGEIINEDTGDYVSDTSLTEQIIKDSQQENKIEKALNATVTVKSLVSHGSGFFIAENGYILTNKHVVKPPSKIFVKTEQILDARQKQLKNIKQYLLEFEKWLDTEKEWLLFTKNSLEKERENLKWERHNLPYASQGKIMEFNRRVRAYNEAGAEYETRRRALIAREEAFRLKYYEYEKGKREHDEDYREFSRRKNEISSQTNFKILLADGTELPASLEKTSDRYDLALLKLAGYDETPYIEIGSPSHLVPGETLFAIGTPYKTELRNTVTSGVFSAHRDNFIQTSAQINPGNSGGPLITKNGKVIGINTLKIVRSDIEGIGFAIPINIALKEFESYLRIYLSETLFQFHEE